MCIICPEHHLIPGEGCSTFLEGLLCLFIYWCRRFSLATCCVWYIKLRNLCCDWDLPSLLNFRFHYVVKIDLETKPFSVWTHTCITCISTNRYTCTHTDIHTLCAAANQDIHLWWGHFESRLIKQFSAKMWRSSQALMIPLSSFSTGTKWVTNALRNTHTPGTGTQFIETQDRSNLTRL